MKMRKKLHFEILKNAYHEIYIKNTKCKANENKKKTYSAAFFPISRFRNNTKNKSYTCLDSLSLVFEI